MTDLRLIRGDTWVLAVDAKKADGTVQSLVGATLRFMAKLRKEDDDGLALITKTTGAGAGIEITDDEAGLATVTIGANTTGDGMPDVLHWDLQLSLPGPEEAEVRTLAMGRIYVVQDVTRQKDLL